MIKIKIINGPNMNLLGKREKNIYGKKTLKYIVKKLKKEFNKKAKIKHFQSNSENKIIKIIQKNKKEIIIINPSGFSYNNLAILDALLAKKTIFIEVHISNIFKREKKRRKTIFSKYAIGMITGMGYHVYSMAVFYILKNHKTLTKLQL